MLLSNWLVTVLFCESIPNFSYKIVQNKRKFPRVCESTKIRAINPKISGRGLVRGVSGVSIDTPRILEISTAEPQFQSVRWSKTLWTPLHETPKGASVVL